MTQSNTEFFPLSERENQLSKIVIDIAFDLHKALGPGLLESVYENCFCYELKQRNILFLRQQPVTIFYKDLLIVELKAQENNHPVWEAQLLSYLKLTGKRIGYIINFHIPLIKNGFKRLIL